MNPTIEICIEKLKEKGIFDEQHKKRLDFEWKEIVGREETEYFLDLYKKKVKAPSNEHNLLIPYLLGIVDDFDIEEEAKYDQGELPDIDCDFLPPVQQYLKETFVSKEYGEKYVCNIANYSTFGIRMSLLDMVRVFGLDRQEALVITKSLPAKDEEGDILTWETAQEQVPNLSDYMNENPEVADAAIKLTHATLDWEKYGYGTKPPHRKRSMGQHASGVVVAGVPVYGSIPLVRGKNGLPASAWVEGQTSTDLQSVGFVKFDFLSLEANNKIARCNKLIMERHGLSSICALPGQPNWSDLSYLEDPKALALANRGDLKAIFQFDSDGIRKLVRESTVTCWDDLAALTALYRPSCLQVGMHTTYCNRKLGKEEYELHPLEQPILGKTYGVLVYQEQVMRYLNIVGGINIHYAQGVIKAISKKKPEKFKKFKDQFISNAQKNLGVTEEVAVSKWAQIESFGGYGFNKSHTVAYTYISSRQLWQKANYPIEFYTTALESLGTGDDRIRDYIQDARKHGVRVSQVNVNYSEMDFSIVNEEIVYGIGKIKGIGEKVAAKVVQKRRYNGFVDFLKKFGTEAKVVQALIALRCFHDADPVKLYKYYEYYKSTITKMRDRDKRFKNSMEKYSNQLNELAGEPCTFDEGDIAYIKSKVTESVWKKINQLYKRYVRSVESNKEKVEKDGLLSLDEFDGEGRLNKEMTALLTDPTCERSEFAYYGFIWTHPIEKAPGSEGITWEQVRLSAAEEHPVEVLIKEVYSKTSSKGNNFYSMACEDATSKINYVVVWKSDYDRWKNELKKGNIVRIRVKPPSGGWSNYSMVSYPRNKTPDKHNDHRVFVLQEKTKETIPPLVT